MTDIEFSFDTIDFSSIIKNDNSVQNNENNENNENKYDKTTNETYRIRRLFKIDPFTDQEIKNDLIFEFKQMWNPYTGLRNDKLDPVGPLCFNAINLYDYFYNNRYKGLWNPPTEQYQGYYGEYIGTSKSIKIKSRGSNPDKYLFRLPIIDCYLPSTHKLSTVTMGPELTDNEISQIDSIVLEHHPKKSSSNFASLTMIKYYYDNALITSPDPDSDEMVELKKKYPNLNSDELNEKYNKYWVDKLVKIKN